MSPGAQPKPVVFLPATDFKVERVFPIRNLEVVDLKDSTSALAQKDNKTLDYAPLSTSHNTSYKVETPADVHSATKTERQEPASVVPKPGSSLSNSLRSISDSQSKTLSHGGGRVTERATFVATTSAPAVVSSGATSGNILRRPYKCEDEPIHIPGAVQAFGVLVALRSNEKKDLEVRIASENSLQLLGRSPEELFSLTSFLDILDDSSRDEIVGRVQNTLQRASDAEGKVVATRLEIVNLTLNTPEGSQKSLWCAMHVSFGTNDLLIFEFEEYNPQFYPGDVHSNNMLPDFPTRTVEIDVDSEERHKSNTRYSQPLRVLEISRQRKPGADISFDVLNAMIDAQAQFGNCTSVGQLMDVAVGIVSELTCFHRVMFYRFDSQQNGCVDAEYIDPRASEDLFRGLHYPASDIPKQARELYKLNRIRVLYDRAQETARLVCHNAADFAVPLDLTHSYLRAMSPVHLKYLENMGVRSSMSISIVINNNLWGLIACHVYGGKGIKVSLPIRELCRNIGDCVAINIERLIMSERFMKRRTIRNAPPPQNPASFIAASSADLLHVFGADFGLLSIQDEARTVGKLEPYREALAILAYLQHQHFTSIYSSHNLNADLPDINYPPGLHTVAGILVIPLSINGGDFLVFFRRSELQEVRWAGNPYEKVSSTHGSYLHPRMSFKHWTEQIHGMCIEWNDDQMETASVLSLLYGRFIEIWRQKEAAGQNKMTRLLIKNSSHEVRTPLNAIVNYLEIALENQLDKNTQDILAKAHKASRSLIYVIDDLLNLTKAEDTPFSAPGEVFDLLGTVSEVITAFRKEAIRKGLDLTVSIHQGIPEMVKGDSSRLRQVLSNVTSNAFQHSVIGGIKVEIRPLSFKGNISVVAITVQDAGIGMTEVQLDGLFQEFEQVFDEHSQSISSTTTPSVASNDGSPGVGLGVGLAVVARYVRNMKGQIRVRSEPGKGTIFGIEVPFESVPRSHESFSQIDDMFVPKAMSDAVSSSLGSEGGSISVRLSSTGINETSRSDSLTQSPSMSGPNPTYSFRPAHPFPRLDGAGSEVRTESLSVLIAEDNPVNSRLLMRRLERLGHSVEVTNDGQECHDHFIHGEGIDALLMDIQMPLVDGSRCTRMIRTYEKGDEGMRKKRRRVPIIAVSASLTEENRFEYIDSGFDGWILKPIDFARLEFILKGIRSPNFKFDALYRPGHFERGGWFFL